MAGQKVQKLMLNIFDCTFGGVCRTFKSLDFWQPGCSVSHCCALGKFGFQYLFFPKQCLHWGVLAVLLKKGLWFLCGSVRARVRSQNFSFYCVWWGSLSSRAGEMVGRERFCSKTQWFRDISVPRCLAGCLDAWMLGCLDAWMPGCLDARMPGCPDAWMPGCLDAWMPGYQFILIQSKIHNPEIDDSLVKKYLTSLFWNFEPSDWYQIEIFRTHFSIRIYLAWSHWRLFR